MKQGDIMAWAKIEPKLLSGGQWKSIKLYIFTNGDWRKVEIYICK